MEGAWKNCVIYMSYIFYVIYLDTGYWSCRNKLHSNEPYTRMTHFEIHYSVYFMMISNCIVDAPFFSKMLQIVTVCKNIGWIYSGFRKSKLFFFATISWYLLCEFFSWICWILNITTKLLQFLEFSSRKTNIQSSVKWWEKIVHDIF